MLTRILRQGRSQKGFTLIELLVVVAIIALLTAFAVPKIFDAISNARNARGQSDMDTISGALDRYYFENDGFPNGTTADATKALLWNGYLKQTTTFINGHTHGYIYLTDGSFYILIDPGKTTGSITVTCGATGSTRSQTVTATGQFQKPALEATNPLTATVVAAGCTITDGKFTTN